MKIRYSLMAMAALAVVSFTACASYRGGAIEGWVVDDKTKQPLEGVVVVIAWEIFGGIVHGSTFGHLLRQETITDQKGHYAFPAWGPIWLKPHHLALFGRLDRSTPALVFFKRGYVPRELRNEYLPEYRSLPSPLKSDWNGKAIELRLYQGDLRDYRKELSAVTYLYDSSAFDSCDWQEIPRLTAEVLKFCEKQGIYCGVVRRDFLRGAHGKECPDPNVVLEELLRE